MLVALGEIFSILRPNGSYLKLFVKLADDVSSVDRVRMSVPASVFSGLFGDARQDETPSKDLDRAAKKSDPKQDVLPYGF